MFTKEERLFIWKKVYEEIERLEDGNYRCVTVFNNRFGIHVYSGRNIGC